MQLEVGAIVEGKVSGITKFGVFVDLEGGKTGLVHISEVAQTYVNEIRDFVQDGQIVKVKILSVGQDGKISLSIKRAADPVPRGSGSRGGPAARAGGAPRPAPHRRPPAASPGRPDGYEWSARTFDNQTFEDKMSKFKQTSDDKFSDLKKKNPDARRSGYSRRGRA